MIRTALALFVAFTLPAAAQVTGSLGPASPVLKRSVTVTGDVVRIGDLIDNAGTAEQIAVFRAPDLGTTGTVSVTQVLQAARAHAVIGIDVAGATEIQVTRASRTITAKDFEATIAQAIAAQIGGNGEIAVKLDRDVRPLHLDVNTKTQLRLLRLAFDPRSSQFDAVIEVPGLNTARLLRFGGKAVETVEVTTLTRPLARGEVVRASDIVVERRPKSEAGEIIGETVRPEGLATRRALRAGQILRVADLMRPELVQRNENVTLIFEAPGIVLTSRAKALEAGAEGDTISVVNAQSKRTIQGTVTGPNIVTVMSMTPRVVAAGPASQQVSQTE